jgi:hypothetical protein
VNIYSAATGAEATGADFLDETFFFGLDFLAAFATFGLAALAFLGLDAFFGLVFLATAKKLKINNVKFYRE